jgi:RNA polymerase sigma-70 factor, ECF subfamily
MTTSTDDTTAFRALVEPYRRTLEVHCYRMLGSVHDAEDAAQETLLRAWRSMDRFEGRSSVHTWLYRIATNVCLDELERRPRRAEPVVEPYPDERLDEAEEPLADPAARYAAREGMELAFLTAIQWLPGRQRAVLILRDVLGWSAAEVAALLDTSPAAANSALQRARATIEAADIDASTTPSEVDGDEERDLLARYVDAFESYDVAAFVSLLSEDAQFSMPHYDLWLRGPEQVGQWLVGQGFACKGSRLVPLQANGSPAFAQYKLSDEPGVRKPWAIVVVETDGRRVTEICSFLGDEHFKAFGLPLELRDAA